MENSQVQTARTEPKATMSLRIKRAGSDEWVDGPDANSVAIHIRGWTGLKVRLLTRLFNFLTRVQSKLEEMK